MKKIGLLLILTLLLVSLAVPVLADGSDGDVVIWGDNYVLEEDEKINGDLLVYGGNVTLKDGSEVKGDTTVFGGNLTLSGEVKGDVTVWGGNVKLASSAEVRGRVMSVGGNIDRDAGADVRGDEIEGLPFEIPAVPKPPNPPKPPMPPKPPEIPDIPVHRSGGSGFLSRVSGFFRSVFGLMLMMVLGILVVVFIPRHTETVAETMVKAPGKCFVSGLVSLVGGSIALAVLATIGSILTVTICLAPLGLAMFLPILVAGIALLFGWIAAGLLLGTKVLRALKHSEPTPVAAVAVGILILNLISFIPCIGWFIALAAVLWSLGAVVQSLFGTRPWQASSASPSAEEPKAEELEDYDPRMDQL
jgi:hypothetical protein